MLSIYNVPQYTIHEIYIYIIYINMYIYNILSEDHKIGHLAQKWITHFTSNYALMSIFDRQLKKSYFANALRPSGLVEKRVAFWTETRV